MSEYQYYEFVAVDRRLTEAEMRELRRVSSRAEITPTSFVNEYNYGDFKGDELAFLEKYFDVHVYVANWGTHRFMVRLPKDLVDEKAVRRYTGEYGFTVQVAHDSLILDFTSRDEGGDDWEEGGEYRGGLLQVRTELARGDERALYLGWLLRVQQEDAGEEEPEPPVPAGLGELSEPLEHLAEFLRIDADLLAVAAERSAHATPAEDESGALAEWIAALPAAEKDALLVRIVGGSEPEAGAKLLARFRASRRKRPGAARDVEPGGRTAGELFAAADRRREEREREEERKRVEARARKQREAAKRRAAYLDELAPRAESFWREVESNVELRQPKAYDLAVSRLVDLRDIAARRKETAAFEARLSALLARYANRPSFLDRIARAGLRTPAR